jgi:hypothetical protein
MLSREPEHLNRSRTSGDPFLRIFYDTRHSRSVRYARVICNVLARHLDQSNETCRTASQPGFSNALLIVVLVFAL